MITGLCIVLMGLLVIIYPQLLAICFGGLLALFGLGMMAASWQFRKLKRQSDSRFINWIVRF